MTTSGKLYIVSWEPEGRYCHRLCTAIAPFWFSTEHLSIGITPFWLSTDDMHIFVCTHAHGPYWNKVVWWKICIYILVDFFFDKMLKKVECLGWAWSSIVRYGHQFPHMKMFSFIPNKFQNIVISLSVSLRALLYFISSFRRIHLRSLGVCFYVHARALQFEI